MNTKHTGNHFWDLFPQHEYDHLQNKQISKPKYPLQIHVVYWKKLEIFQFQYNVITYVSTIHTACWQFMIKNKCQDIDVHPHRDLHYNIHCNSQYEYTVLMYTSFTFILAINHHYFDFLAWNIWQNDKQKNEWWELRS